MIVGGRLMKGPLGGKGEEGRRGNTVALVTLAPLGMGQNPGSEAPHCIRLIGIESPQARMGIDPDPLGIIDMLLLDRVKPTVHVRLGGWLK